MELDKRIIEGKRPLTCFDSEFAKQFIGKKGFVAAELDQFCDLNKTQESTLKNVWPNETYCFVASVTSHKYFLPSEWVKEPEKKYRPFSIEEWKFKHSIGETILYRYKGAYCGEAELAYLGYFKPLDGTTDESGKGHIVLGNNAYSLQNLFDNYEMWVDGEWKPFGEEE
jgi:hypothetical protein